MKSPLLLALDCGTTGNRAILFDNKMRARASSYREFKQYYPKAGWVEHDAEEIWQSTRRAVLVCLKQAPRNSVAGVGITNQRETVVVWDPKTGKPLSRAVVWQCRRSTEICQELKKRGWEGEIRRKTGLFLDPYFSGSKILWLTRHHAAIRAGLKKGSLLCGTIDAWIIWKLTDGVSFSTDPTNASRTLLYDIRRGQWDPELCRLFAVNPQSLPAVLASCGIRAWTSKKILGCTLPIAAVAGDQQSSAFAQGCFRQGVVKNTYGTGLFVVAQTGPRLRRSKALVTTIACATGKSTQYALEGSIFVGGAVIQWLRDGLKLIGKASQSEKAALSVNSSDGVYFVPALAGLGCPHWDPQARGLITGLTRKTRSAHLIRAALESLAYQTRDVLDLLKKDLNLKIKVLNVDGGAVGNNFLMQFQADILGCAVQRPRVTETTAQGVAGLAGIAVGWWKNKERFLKTRNVDRIFKPKMNSAMRQNLYRGWQESVDRAKSRIKMER